MVDHAQKLLLHFGHIIEHMIKEHILVASISVGGVFKRVLLYGLSAKNCSFIEEIASVGFG